MKRALIISTILFVLAGAAFSACAPPPPGPGCCGHTTTVARMTEYTGTIPSTDGGTPTTVKVSVATNGNTTLTFENGGRTIVQAFTGSSP